MSASQTKHEKAIVQLKEYQEEIYNKGMKEYRATNWATAKKWFGLLGSPIYEDSMEMFAKCIENAENERAAYNGIWIETSRFWTNLKIDATGVYYASQDDTKRDDWSSVNSQFNEDTGALSFRFWNGNEYTMSLQGNRLKIKWTNPKDQYDSDWFGSHNVFYRQ